MNKFIMIVAALKSITAIVMEVALYMMFIIGKCDYMQLLYGWCMLRLAEYCMMKVLEWKKS